MTQNGLGFARVMVAVVTEENDFAADFGLEPPGRLDFGNEKTFAGRTRTVAGRNK